MHSTRALFWSTGENLFTFIYFPPHQVYPRFLVAGPFLNHHSGTSLTSCVARTV